MPSSRTGAPSGDRALENGVPADTPVTPVEVLGAMDPNIEWHEAEGNPYDPGHPFVGPDATIGAGWGRPWQVASGRRRAGRSSPPPSPAATAPQSAAAAPVLLPVEEFARSLDAFPIEFGAIIAHHAPVYGSDPFEGLAVRAAAFTSGGPTMNSSAPPAAGITSVYSRSAAKTA